MRILIVDDEPIAQDILETYIARIPGCNWWASAATLWRHLPPSINNR